MLTAPLPACVECLDWQDAESAVIDRAAHYVVETNDDVREVWDGTTLLLRQRAEFQVGRAVWVAKVPSQERADA